MPVDPEFRRNGRLRLAGATLAFANLGFCYVAALIGPFKGSRLPLLSNSSNYGWFVALMMLLAIVHLPFALLSALIYSVIPRLRGRGGRGTLTLAFMPWAEWAAFFVLGAITTKS